MLSASQPFDTTSFPLGRRQGTSDLARSALELTWADREAESKALARSKAYPSPPMSGSPPLPPKPLQEAGDRGQQPTSYPTSSPQDVHRGSSTRQPPPPDPRAQPPGPPPLPRAYAQEPAPAMTYASYRRHDEPAPLPSAYHPQHHQGLPPPLPGMSQQPYMHVGVPIPSAGPGYPVPGGPPPLESQPFTSPKTQRKTKGHVASACVPCKRAHLRCDAQRPCSRCLGNGKADACVDVQHKKRGRPRLRDERDARYDTTRFPHPQDVSMRRPLSIYPSGSAGGPGYEDPLRPSQTHRILKSQPSESMTPRFPERGSASDANIYPAPIPLAARPAEHVAYLTLDMEFASASPTFVDAIGGVNVRGRTLMEILVPVENERAIGIQNQLVGEQKRREPNYLPPILGRGDQIIRGLGFSADDIARYHLDRHEYLTFVGADGQHRHYPVRLGLAKEESYFFVVMVLNIQPRYPYLSPSQQYARETPSQYHSQPSTPQSAYSQHAPAPSAYDPGRQRFYEGPPPPRQLPGPPNMPARQSPGISPGGYSQAGGRAEYPSSASYQVPRSELPPVTRPASQPSYQLPPIRSQLEQGAQQPQSQPHSQPQPREQGWPRDDRSSRVDIGGLLEKPEGPGRPQ